jgi:hypothetical protein
MASAASSRAPSPLPLLSRNRLEFRQRRHPPVGARPRLDVIELRAVGLEYLRAHDQEHVEVGDLAAKSLAARSGQHEADDLGIILGLP